MRLVRLRLVEDPTSSLSFHPRLTVVYGLTPEARQFLVEAMTLMLNGQSAGVIADIDVDGDRIAVGPGERRIPAPLDVINPVVRAQDLLEPRMSAAGRGGAGGRSKPVPKATPDELAKARARRESAAQSLQMLTDTVQRLGGDLQLATAARESASIAIDRCLARLDPEAVSALDVAVADARDLENTLAVEPGAARGDTIDSVKARIEQLEAHLTTLAGSLAELLTVPAHAMEEAVDLLALHVHPGSVPSRRARQLADRWMSLRTRLGEIEGQVVTPDGTLSDIGERLELARVELRDAEMGTHKRTVTNEDIRELEAAHDDVLEAERRSNSRFGGSRAQRQLELAMQRQQEILDRVGYPTWSAFVMGDRMLDAAKDAKRRLERAHAEVERLESKWREVSARLEANTEFAVVLDQIDAVYHEAHGLVGETEDLETALRNHRYDPGPPQESISDATARVVRELEALDLEIEDASNAVRVFEQAQQWLAENELLDQHRQVIERDFEHATTELDDASAVLARIEALGASEESRLATGARLATARAAITAAEARVWRNRATLIDLTKLLTERRTATRLEWRLNCEHTAKTALRDVAETMERSAAIQVARIEAAMRDDSPIVSASYRSTGATDESSVLGDYIEKRGRDPEGHSLVGPLPLLLDDCFAGISPELTSALLYRLERTTERNQIVYLTDERSFAEFVATNFSTSAIVATGTGFFKPRSQSAVP